MALVTISNIEDHPDDETEFLYASDEGADFVICKRPDKLKRLIDSLQASRSVHYISDGDWSMHDLVMQLLQQYQPADVYITTYAIREFPVRQLILAQSRKEIKSIKMLLDYRARARTPEVFEMASMNVNKIGLTSLHAKVTVIDSPAGAVTIVGSANWTQNPRIEAGVITLDPSAAAFHIEWINKVLNEAEIFE